MMLGTAQGEEPTQADRPRGSYVWVDPPTSIANEHDVPRLIFLNRCKDGCTLTPGSDNAIDNVSQIVPNTVNIAPFGHGDAVWDEVMTCVRDQFAQFNVNITDQDPGTIPHFEAIVAGNSNDVAPGALGIAPFSCGVLASM